MATTKPTIGRPRRTKSLASERLTIRLTVAERAELERAAGAVPVSDWMRDVALAVARR
jgi:hypothetical protein